MTSKFLTALKPFMYIMPECTKPERKVTFREKITWTLVVLIVYLVMSQIPLYGVPRDVGGGDPFFWMRAILASNRGTLTELGIGPIVTAGLVMQLLVGSKIIDVDMSDPDDRALFTGAQKVLALIVTVFQAMAFVFGGAYGALDFNAMVWVMLQLSIAGLVIILMDELIQKGWGLGSGISLFIAAGVCGQILWNLFSPLSADDGMFHGAFLAFFQALLTGKSLSSLVLRKAAPTAPDLIGVIGTIIAFMVVIYFESIRIEIPLTYAKYRGFRGKYPIKLLYVSVIPVILAAALFADLYLVSQLMWKRWRYAGGTKGFLVRILGNYEDTDQGVQPVSGLTYYFTPPRGLEATVADPFRALMYLLIFTFFCVIFAKLWVEVAGMAPRDVARQLIDSGMQIPGFRRSPKTVERLLERYIPTAAIIGGLFIGILAATSDFLGALGTGTGILLAVGIIKQYATDILPKEQLSEQHPALAGFLGIM